MYTVICALLIFLFSAVGCIKTTGSLNEVDPSLISFEGIQFKTKRYAVYVNNELLIPQTDLKGVAPFEFKIDQGIGSINASSGLYKAPDVLGFAVISIKDSEGRLGYISIEVVDDLKVNNTDFSMVVGTSTLLQISGGKYPYTFSVEKGDIAVDKIGVIKAGLTEGPATIKVVDSAGNVRTVNLTVVKNLSISPSQFSVTLNGSKDLTVTGGVGFAQLSVNSGVGSATTSPSRFTAGTTTGTTVVAATDEMGNVGYAYGQVFGSLQISPHIVKIPKGQSYNHFEALGGVPPFTFSIQGSGTVDPTTGQYTAPANTGTDTVTVTDSLGNTSQATITITNSDRFIVKNAIIQLNETLDFTNLIDGGAEPYVFNVNPGEGNFSGKVYTPPATTGNYVVTITENGGQTTQSIVFVYPSLKLNPNQLNIAVQSLGFFSAQGGVPPYTFALVSGLGTIDSQTGVYNSGMQTGTAVVSVTDAKNHTAQSTVIINARLDLVADIENIEVGGNVNFTASGGLSPYTFSIVTGSGSLAANGADKVVLTAGLNAGIVQVEVKDAIGNRVSKYVQVLTKLTPTPQTLNLKVNQQYNFGAQGGLSPYNFSLVSGSGTITTDGLYKASASASTDKIKVTDSVGNTSEATIVVYENMQMLPQSKTILVGGTLQMSVTGGIAPIVYSISSGQGSINQQGLFTASSTTAGNVVIHAIDNEGNFADSVVVVNPALEILPSSVSLKTNKSYNFAAGGGVPPYKFSVVSANGGTINSATGDYKAPNSAGEYKVQVQDNTGNISFSSVSVSNSGNQPTSGPADHMLLLAGDAQSGTVQTVLPTSFQVKVVDQNGNAVSGQSLKITRLSGNGTAGFATVTTGIDGTASTPYFLGTVAGSDVVRIESAGTAFPGSPSSIDFTVTATPAAPSPFTSTLVANPNSAVPADGSTAANLTITIKDIYGNAIPNATVNISATGTGNTLNLSSSTTNSLGKVTGTLKSTVAENKTLSFISPAELSGISTVVGFGATVTPDATMSGIIGSATTVADGVSTATITINLQSAAGQPAAGYVPTFSATDTNNTNTYGTCSMSDVNGNSTCTLKSTKAESKILTLLTPVNKTGVAVTFIAGATDHLTFTQQPVSANINTALNPQPIVEIQDAYSNRITSGTDSTASITLNLFSGTGNLLGTVAMNAVNGVADFNGKGIAFDRSGTKVLKATSGSFTKNSSPFSITSFPTLLSWSGANNFARGSCSSLTVSAYDANSDLTVLNSAMPVTLGGAGGTFYSDSSCLSPIVNTQIAMGTSGQIIYYKNNTSGNYTLTADASNLPQASYNVTLVIPPPTKLVWSGPTFGKNGACSGALTITSQDGTNQSANVTDNTVVTLGGQGSGSFYSDAGCGSSISQATINAGSSSTVVYFKDTVGETLTFTADATGLTQGSYAYQGQYPVLYLSGTGGSTIDGVAITSCGGTDVCNSTNPYVISTDAKFYSVTMVNGAYAAGQAWTSGTPNAGNGILSISVQSNFNLCLTCNINVDGKGYTAGNGPGAGSGVSGTGGSYGGLGGVGASAVASAASYGSVTAPTDLGSGGSVNGGKGGGSIRLNVAGTLTLNGTITSNGTAGATYCCWGSASGGSGGSIQITTGTLAGSTGILHADGGAGGDGNAGGGSGGRIAINYGTDSYSGGAIAIGKSGFGGGSSRSGGAGTIFLLHNGVETYGSLVVDNNGHVGEVTPLMASSNFDNLIVKNKGNLQIPGAMSLQSTTVNFNDGVITNNGSYLNAVNTITGINLVNGGTLNIPGGNLIIGAGGTLTLATGAPLALTNLTIQSGGSVTHAANSTAKTYFVDISVSNKLQIDFGGSINADGKGYTAQNGPGAGSGSNGTGGSYGGLGGIGTSGVAAASGYGSVTAPTHLGSGGSVNGGTGGGSIRLNIGDTLVLNGTISSNGTAGVAYCCYASSAGGSGGSIQITTATLTGSTGTLHVNGGAGGDPNYGNGGGGGGGRIAVNYTTDSYTGSIDALTMSSYGGGASIPGGAGTIFLMHTGVDTNGRLIIDNNNQTGYTTPLLASSNFDSVTIKNKGNLEIPAGLTLQSTTANFNSGLLTNKGSYLNAINTIFGWNLINSGTLNIPGGNLTIGSGGTLTFANGAPLALTNLTIQNSGLITHLANSNAKTYFVDISVSNKLQIDLGGSINADGKGYTAQNGPGAGSGSNGTGGSYGGLGGVGTSGVAAASSYGSVTAPTDLGSGGSANGGTGGGAIRLNVGDTLVLNGTISSNGTAGVAYCCYASSAGGSGGSIKITTGTLTGSTGALHVDGGNGGDPNYGYGGSGGGGRLAINYTTDSYTGNIDGLLMSAYGGSKNFPGGAGTIFLMHTGVDTNGRLIIDNNNQIAAATPLLDNYNFDFVILRNRGSLATNAGQSLTQDQIVGSTGGTLTNNGSITLSTLSGVNIINNGTLNFPSGNLTIASGGTLTTVGSAPLTVGNLTILSGGTLTHFTNTTVKTNWLNLNVTGNLQIDLGGSIDVSGKGFAAQSGPGAGGAGNGAAGGCYGGIGGLGYSSSTKGVGYGSIINPVDLGSAGGNFNGGGYNGLAGGGAALITVGGTLTVNGTILANGVGSTSSANYDARRGSGSGGSINITTNAIAGTTGMLQAKGGSSIAGQWNSGGGGGGRIALIYSSDAYSGGINGLSISASGGTSCGQGSCTDAGAGSIFIKDTVGNPNGLVLIDNFSINGENSVINEDLTLNSLTLSNKGHTEFKTGKTLNLNSFTINNSQLTNYGTVNATGWSFTNGASYINIGTFTPSLSTISDFSFENYGTISIPTNALTIGNNGTFIVGTNSLVLNNLTISSGGTLTHSKNLGTSKDYVLNLTINNNLTVDSGGKIDVSAKGFRYQQGSGAGGTGNGAAGGCYGGVGGLGYTSSTACTSFGSSTNPTDLGGSGGNFDSGTLGRAGGGAAIITVAGTFTLNGSVIANGEAPASSADSWQRAGSGSGGSININANILAGSGGTLSAKGGSAFTAAWGSGGGGGGRIALACTTDSYTNGKATIITNVSGGTGCGYGSCTSGGAGTVYESP